MQIYCFDIEGTPDWPNGTAITAHDRRTASSVLLYRDLGPDPQADRTRPGSTSQPQATPGQPQAILERRRKAFTVINTISATPPPTASTEPQPLRPQVELFTFGNFIGLAAPNAAAAAPALEKLRAQGLFRVANPPPPPPPPAPRPPPPPAAVCLHCRQPRPLNAAGLCAACTSAPTTTKPTKSAPRSRLWRAILLLLALSALTLYIWWPKPETRRATQPVLPPTVQFSANHQTVRKGSRVLLSWNTSGFSSISISPNFGPVPASGKRWVVINHDTTFSLKPVGTTYVRPVNVTISVIDPGATQPAKPSAYSGATPEANRSPTPEIQPPKQPDATQETTATITATLNDWAAAYRSNDPRREAALYAPQVERFFKQQNVTSAYVQTYMTNFHARGSRFTSFTFTNPTINFVDNDTARVFFTKIYTQQSANGEIRNVTSRSELHLTRTTGSTWKINFERDLLG